MKVRMLALGLALASGLAMAQAGPASSGSPGASAKPPQGMRMQNALNLTDEQVAKMREIRDNGGTREEMDAVLTPEQRAKAAELREAHKADRSQRKSRMKDELGLSDEQVEKMREIRDNGGTREEMRAVLTPEQQAKFDSMRSKRSAHGPMVPPPKTSPAANRPPKHSAPAPAPAAPTQPADTQAKPAAAAE